MQRQATDIFIVLFLAFLAIDVTPRQHLAHETLKNALDPIYDLTGLWQGEWNLFAPNPDRTNGYLSAEFVYEDGSTTWWISERPADLTAAEKFRYFKRFEYYDKIRLDENRDAWSAFADYLYRTHASDEHGPVARIYLFRHSTVIPSPSELNLPEEDSSAWERWHFYTLEVSE